MLTPSLDAFSGEIEHLAGCDFLTIAPKLLEQLKSDKKQFERKLSPEKAQAAEKIAKVSFVDNRTAFDWELFQDEMAWDKLHSGIRGFAAVSTSFQPRLKRTIAGSPASAAQITDT